MRIRRRILLAIILLLLVFVTILVVYLVGTKNDHEYRGTFVENTCKEVEL